MIRAVVFDFYGTLAFIPDGLHTLEVALTEHGYELPPGMNDHWWYEELDGMEHAEHSQSRDHYVAWQHARLSTLLAECAVPGEHHASIAQRVDAIGAERVVLAYDEVTSVLDALRDRDCTVAVCSNWSWDLDDALARAGLDGRAEVTLSSAWVGARKPHPRIYAHTIEALGCAPDEVLFIGDTWSCDVAGPRAAGMHAMYLRRADAPPDRTAPDALDVRVAADLTAVLRIN